MKTAPVIRFDDLRSIETVETDAYGFQKSTRNHADFGTWEERCLNLGHIRLFEHKVNFHTKMDVHFSEESLDKYVHHCMSVRGQIDAKFHEYKIDAHLPQNTFHNMYLPGGDYFIGMGDRFINIHMEVEREHYFNLLGDSEDWSACLRQKLINGDVHYEGESQLTGQMLQTIYSIFNSEISGSLKKLLIEAKTHELIALQLHHLTCHKQGREEKTNRDQFHAIREYLDNTFLATHSLRSISRHFGINEFALKKGFKSNFNTTVFDHLLSMRLMHSQRLLQDTDESIVSIASLVGYKYPNHFSAAFKKKFGVSPADYRKN